MELLDVHSGRNMDANISLVSEADYKFITKKKFSFNWKVEKQYQVYKIHLIGSNEILGLVSLQHIDDEYRIQIRLLAVSSSQIGVGKTIAGIAGNMIAYAYRLAVNKYGFLAAVSLLPKTILTKHYMTMYGFEQAGKHLFLEGENLHKLLKRFGYE